MASFRKLFRSVLKLILPIAVVLILAAVGTSVWLAHVSSKPPVSQYLVTPAQYGRLSTRGARITDEKWTYSDGTDAKAWLLRGGENQPAVILLHRYGTDRSWVLNLGVKINEQTNFTVLMPEQRGHGEDFEQHTTTFGVCETGDMASAIKFLRTLQSPGGNPLVGQSIGAYGLEMGAYTAMSGAAANPEIKTLVLDSVPLSADDVIGSVVSHRFPFAGAVTSVLATQGNRIYHNSCYQADGLCKQTEKLAGRQVLLLAGADAPRFKDTTRALSTCLPKQNKVESKLELALSGIGITTAAPEEADLYDQRIIDFFQQNLK